MYQIKYSCYVILLAWMFGCEQEPSTSAHPPLEDPIRVDSSEKVFQPEAVIDTFRSKHFYTYTFDPKRVDLRMFNPHAGGFHTFQTVAKLADSLGLRVELLMNGGMFKSDRSAQGLLILEGNVLQSLDLRTSGYGNFYLQPNGVFFIDSLDNAQLVTPQTFADSVDAGTVRYATQSGPMLLVQGMPNPLFSDPSPNLHIRNGVGITPNGLVVFAISEQPVTFYELAELFRLKGCDRALYLDGFVSRLYLPKLGVGSLAGGENLGPLIAIFQEPNSIPIP